MSSVDIVSFVLYSGVERMQRRQIISSQTVSIWKAAVERKAAIFVVPSSLLEGEDMEAMELKLFFFRGTYQQSRQLLILPPHLPPPLHPPHLPRPPRRLSLW